MRPPRLIAAALLAAAAVSAPVSAPAAPAKAAADWTRTVVVTPEGGFRIGNPAAKVKLVEYGSLTCPHCASFSAEAEAGLAALVRSGKLSFEYRNFVLNGIDLTASLLARCAGPAAFFPLTERLFETQETWVGRINGLGDEEIDKLEALPPGERLAHIAEVGGLTALAAEAGVNEARGRKCLADEAAVDRLGQIGEAASALGVEGTPTFFLNGAMLGVNTWPEIEPLIRQAGD